MKTKVLFIVTLLGLTAMLAACGGGNSTAVEPSNQPTPSAEQPNNPSPDPSSTPTFPAPVTPTTPSVGTPTMTVPTASCEGQNGSIDVPRAPGALTGRALAVNDLGTLKGDYCNNSNGKHQIRSGSAAFTVTNYDSCSLKVEDTGRLTLKAGDKTFTALVDGSSRDRVVGGAVSSQDPSLAAVYSVSAVDESNSSPIERVDVGIHRGRVVFASGERPNVATGPFNDEKLICTFLNPTQVGSLAQTNLVGGYATASDLASSLVTQVQGTVTGISQGQVLGRACSITINVAGLITIIAPELNGNSEFTGINITTVAKLDGDASDRTTLQNGTVSINAVTGTQQLTVFIDQSTQRIQSAMATNGGFCQVTQ